MHWDSIALSEDQYRTLSRLMPGDNIVGGRIFKNRRSPIQRDITILFSTSGTNPWVVRFRFKNPCAEIPVYGSIRGCQEGFFRDLLLLRLFQ